MIDIFGDEIYFHIFNLLLQTSNFSRDEYLCFIECLFFFLWLYEKVGVMFYLHINFKEICFLFI